MIRFEFSVNIIKGQVLSFLFTDDCLLMTDDCLLITVY
ncbi:hypothetical protein BH695_2423 [Microcystis aeruginosa PCC 7806SL]|uniref:Reverse transcriptase domain-containing protein n=1 Tax=Microcystis aeruginosa PCC 7806SL TaxID=1903187 RepID=A0AB33BS94_MICA7|nr:hypothetical protein BH695_2423 [Microcystis aeruginosa PCC 7806SL]